MARPGPDGQPIHQALEHVKAFASAVGVVPGLLGLRQINKNTFSLLLDTKIIRHNGIGREYITYEMIDLRVDTGNNWSVPDENQATGRRPVSMQEAADFGAPYIREHLAQQKPAFKA